MKTAGIIAEIQRLQEAIERSNSPYLKRDYTKRLKKLRRNLHETSRRHN